MPFSKQFAVATVFALATIGAEAHDGHSHEPFVAKFEGAGCDATVNTELTKDYTACMETEASSCDCLKPFLENQTDCVLTKESCDVFAETWEHDKCKLSDGEKLPVCPVTDGHSHEPFDAKFEGAGCNATANTALTKAYTACMNETEASSCACLKPFLDNQTDCALTKASCNSFTETWEHDKCNISDNEKLPVCEDKTEPTSSATASTLSALVVVLASFGAYLF